MTVLRVGDRPHPKLIAVNLDGTLLDSGGVPHETDARALRAAMASGVHVSILTGRLYSGTRPAAMAIGIEGAVGCVDGSHVVRVSTHSTLMHHGIIGPDALSLRDALARSGTTAFSFVRDSIVHDAQGDAYVGYVTTWSSDLVKVGAVFEDDSWGHAEGVTAVVAIGTVDQVSGAVQAIQAVLKDAVQVAMFPLRRIAGTWGLVVRAAEGTKGTALAWLAGHYGISIEETVVVGDWLNDLPMFHVAGRAYAMGQSPDEVKSAATDVLRETSETGGGIARVVREVFGIAIAEPPRVT